MVRMDVMGIGSVCLRRNRNRLEVEGGGEQGGTSGRVGQRNERSASSPSTLTPLAQWSASHPLYALQLLQGMFTVDRGEPDRVLVVS